VGTEPDLDLIKQVEQVTASAFAKRPSGNAARPRLAAQIFEVSHYRPCRWWCKTYISWHINDF
jgi:hypothetical protein